jgi:putative hemolysin
VLIITYVSLLIGELVPKRLAIRNPEGFATAIARLFEFLIKLVKLPIRVLLASADLVLRILGAADTEEELISSEEIELLVRRGAAEGVILPIQERMIERVIDYADRTTRSEMTPRVEIISFDAETSIRSALNTAKTHGFSRYPVVQGNMDTILGYIHIKDLIWAHEDDQLTKHLRPIVYIPGAVALPKAFTTLTHAGWQMGIVIDEYGGTEGLITLEDILEVIVGEIEDEHSPTAEIPKHSEDGEWRIAGSEPISKVGEILDIDFDSRGVFSTLGGFLTSALGNFPKENDFVSFSGYCFVVKEMDRFRVVSVQVTRISQRGLSGDNCR